MIHKLTNLFLFAVCVLLSAQTYADSMEERRITISASIFPRLIAVDQNILDKLDESGNVRFGMLFVSDKDKAKEISKKMTRKIKKIAGKKIVFEFVNFESIDLSKLGKLSGIFLVESMSDVQIRKIIKYSKDNHVLSFSPFEGDVEKGITASIFVGAKIRPYFNTKSLNSSKINLNPALLKVSKIYE